MTLEKYLGTLTCVSAYVIEYSGKLGDKKTPCRATNVNFICKPSIHDMTIIFVSVEKKIEIARFTDITVFAILQTH
jgi:hypothetical protein